MPDDVRYVAGGAVLGAVLGALAGWTYARFSRKGAGDRAESDRRGGRVERGQLLRLGWAVIGVIRQVLELG